MSIAVANNSGWGLIAGNGRFPFLVLEGARSQGIEMAVIAIKEEAAPELEAQTKRLHWVSLGELSKTIDLLHKEGVTQAVMAGQVKHTKIFSAIRPDWKLAKLLFALPRKNTDALIGAVAKILEDEGIRLVSGKNKREEARISPGVIPYSVPQGRIKCLIDISSPVPDRIDQLLGHVRRRIVIRTAIEQPHGNMYVLWNIGNILRPCRRNDRSYGRVLGIGAQEIPAALPAR